MKNIFKLVFFNILFTCFLFFLVISSKLGLGLWIVQGCIDSGFELYQYKCLFLEKSIIILIPLFLFSLFLYLFLKKFHKETILIYIFSISFILIVSSFIYYSIWKTYCRGFPIDTSLPNIFAKGTLTKCPSIYNPFSWSLFDKDWRNFIESTGTKIDKSTVIF